MVNDASMLPPCHQAAFPIQTQCDVWHQVMQSLTTPLGGPQASQACFVWVMSMNVFSEIVKGVEGVIPY